MVSVPYFVGIDYHKEKEQVCIINQEGEILRNVSVKNDADTIANIVRPYGVPLRAAIEACCGAANLADQLATRYNIPVKLAHPGYVARMKRTRDKHDAGDAYLLADLARVNYLPEVWLAPETTRQLRRLVRYREQLVQQRTRTKVRVRALLRDNRIKEPKGLNAWTKGWFAWLEHQKEITDDDRWMLQDHQEEIRCLAERIKKTAEKIDDYIADDPMVSTLLTMEGVGPVTAAVLRAEIGSVNRFQSGKELARFCGVTPCNASSGKRQADSGMVKAGNKLLRKVLVELGHRLARSPNSKWYKKAVEMRKRGKHANVVAVALANRWVRRMYYELKRSQQPDPDLSFLGSGSTKGDAPSASAVSRSEAGVATDVTAKAKGA